MGNWGTDNLNNFPKVILLRHQPKNLTTPDPASMGACVCETVEDRGEEITLCLSKGSMGPWNWNHIPIQGWTSGQFMIYGTPKAVSIHTPPQALIILSPNLLVILIILQLCDVSAINIPEQHLNWLYFSSCFSWNWEKATWIFFFNWEL